MRVPGSGVRRIPVFVGEVGSYKLPPAPRPRADGILIHSIREIAAVGRREAAAGRIVEGPACDAGRFLIWRSRAAHDPLHGLILDEVGRLSDAAVTQNGISTSEYVPGAENSR